MVILVRTNYCYYWRKEVLFVSLLILTISKKGKKLELKKTNNMRVMGSFIRREVIKI